MKSTALVWWRRDLRLTDHRALGEAVNAVGPTGEVVPVYVLSQWSGAHRWTGPNRQQFLGQCLASLDANLRAKGSRLIVRAGDAVAELLRLASETKAKEIFAHRDPDPFGRAIEHRLIEKAEAVGVRVHFYLDHSFLPPDAVRTGAGDPYRVFTPYSKAWRAAAKWMHQIASPPAKLPACPSYIESLPLPTLATWSLPAAGSAVLAAGERAARERFRQFIEAGIFQYGTLRDIPSMESTSRWSQDLRFGLVSLREIFSQCAAAAEKAIGKERDSVDKFVSELIWREFYFSILWHYPEVLEKEFNPTFQGMPWPGRAEALHRWQEGTTGFPIVDAGMRQLRATGFMHNRVRMITAMFLTKDLHVDWREGESWFLKHLTDGDIASNNGGWQWSAGTGADAAPYFRIQNPWSQTKRYDPDGIYIKRWVPELAGVDSRTLLEPPANGKSIVPGYPAPMLDHAAERDKTLEIFGNWKSAHAGAA